MKEMMIKEMSHDNNQNKIKKKTYKKERPVEQRIKTIDVTEHVEVLMSGEGDLTDEFKKKYLLFSNL